MLLPKQKLPVTWNIFPSLTLVAILPFLSMTSAAETEPPVPEAPRTALVHDTAFLNHETGEGFPEHPDRVRNLTGHLEQHPISKRLLWIAPDEKIDPLPWIHLLHDEKYVKAFKQTCEAGERQMHGSADTPISRESYQVALQAVTAALTAVDLVMEGEVRNAFAAVRPPGHHSMADRAKGFCFFANAAIAARYAQKHHKLERVMIVDWDVHHGDGTQSFFLEDPSVYFVSTHQYPFYPGPSGDPEITGKGPGEGFNLNIALAAGSGDAAVIEAFENQITTAFRKFEPELVIISAGFDAHEDDPLGSLGWTSGVYGKLTEILRSLCREQGHERIVSLLEGGYSERGITEGVRRHIEALEAPVKED
jgi:acetoin utilization deacetylase AcuC-like enzyme